MNVIRRIIAAAVAVTALSAVWTLTPVSASAAIRPATHYVQLGDSGRCVTAVHFRPGAEVKALPCAHLASQRWVIGGGPVRLAGTRLRLTISPRSHRVVVTGHDHADRWKLGHHYLRDLTMSARYRVRMVLTLPATLHHRALPGFHLFAAQLLRFVHTKSRIINQGFQRVSLSPVRR